MSQTETDELTPDPIMEVGTGFFASKTLLSAVELELFTLLAERGPMTAESIVEHLDLDGRGSRDFLDALVALEFLEREDGEYRNAPVTEKFLDKNKPSYVGGILEMANDRLYPFWDDLTEALRTGEPQNEIEDERHPFEEIYADEERLAQFLGAMTGLSGGVGEHLAEAFPWNDYDSVVDFGCAAGAVPAAIARENEHLEVAGFDLPKVEKYYWELAEEQGLDDRLEFHAGDFFEDPLPETDVAILGHILHDWGTEDKRRLLSRVHGALNDGGALIIHGNIIDDDRSENAMGLLMSLNMLIETPDGYDYTPSQAFEWLDEAGFSDYETRPAPGPERLIVAHE